MEYEVSVRLVRRTPDAQIEERTFTLTVPADSPEAADAIGTGIGYVIVENAHSHGWKLARRHETTVRAL